MKVLIVYYSMYGHIHKMAEGVAEGVREITGAEAILRRVPETLPTEVLEKMGAVEAQKSMSNVPICTVDELGSADAVIFPLVPSANPALKTACSSAVKNPESIRKVETPLFPTILTSSALSVESIVISPR